MLLLVSTNVIVENVTLTSNVDFVVSLNVVVVFVDIRHCDTIKSLLSTNAIVAYCVVFVDKRRCRR
jgi:hypothetical protein